jgi:predicted transcriptional regulator
MKQPARCGALRVLIGLCSRYYGLTVPELIAEAKIKRSGVFRSIRMLERLGCEITRHHEEIRGGWRTLYRLEGVRGMRIRRTS